MKIDFQGFSNTVDLFLAEVKKDIAERRDLSDAEVRKLLDDQYKVLKHHLRSEGLKGLNAALTKDRSAGQINQLRGLVKTQWLL